MDNTKSQQDLPKATNIADYIHDMAELEAAEFTLRKTAEEITKRATNEEVTSRHAINENTVKLKQIEEKISEKNRYAIDSPQEPQIPKELDGFDASKRPKEPFGYSFLEDIILDPLRFLYIGLFLLFPMLFLLQFSALIFSVIIGIILLIALFLIFYYFAIYSPYEKLRLKYVDLLKKYEAYNENYVQWREENSKYCEYVRTMDNLNRDKISANKSLAISYTLQKRATQKKLWSEAQAKLLIKYADYIKMKKNELYNLNIVPPDYRELDCVIMFDQIFRNNLADSIREAVMIYEERVFRQEVIRGIEKIYTMLGQLSYSMKAIEDRLIEVRNEVRNVGNDLFNAMNDMISGNERILGTIQDNAQTNSYYQQQTVKFQEQILTSSKATQYAINMQTNCNYKYDWYINQARQGLL